MYKDDNYIYFLTDKMTKAKVYPPAELKTKLNYSDIINGWQELSQRVDDSDYKDPKLGLYLHLPFCPSKCLFCYCPSKQENDFNKISHYIEQMLAEVDLYAPILKDFQVDSIYVGGGTPSYLTQELIKKLFEYIFSNFKMSEDLQFNFEASPHTLNKEKLDSLKELGVTRLSMGVQSISGKVLNNINRQQSLDVLEKIINYSRKIGIPHINLDYVAGLPGETLQSFIKGFSEILKLRPEIIHLYAFCPTKDTLYIKQGNQYTEDQVNLRSKMQKVGEKMIRNSGYKEIKNDSWGLNEKAKNRQEAGRKDSPYSILGLGNSARSNIFKIMAYINSPSHYDNKEGEISGHKINAEEELRHFLMLAFRGGIDPLKLNKIFNININDFFAKELDYLKKNNKLKIENNQMYLMADNTNEYHFLLKKLFYSPQVLEQLKEYYKNDYNPSIDYKSKLIKVFDKNF